MKLFLLLIVFLFSALNSYSAVKTWDGGGVDGSWTKGANWVGDVAPESNDDLVFPTTSAQFATTNDFSTTFFSFASLTIEGGDYTIGGNNLRLTNGLTVNGGTQLLTPLIQIVPEPFSSSSGQTFRAAQGSTVILLRLFIGSGFSGSTILTLDGAGSFEIGVIFGTGSLLKTGLGSFLIASGSNYDGAITLSEGALVVNANIPESTVTINAGTFGGIGTVGAITATGGVVAPGQSPGNLTSSGRLTLNNAATLNIEIGGLTAGTQYDRLTINTAFANLNGANLTGSLINGFNPAAGTAFTILQTSGPGIMGQFAQGSSVVFSGRRFNIDYGPASVVLTATAGVTVSGRVTTPDGRSLRNAVVTMTDSNSGRRIVTTSSFGFYTFNDVGVGQYTMSVASKRYRFSPQVVQVNAALTNVDFVGQE